MLVKGEGFFLSGVLLHIMERPLAEAHLVPLGIGQSQDLLPEARIIEPEEVCSFLTGRELAPGL